jgi:hypothetical protein
VERVRFAYASLGTVVSNPEMHSALVLVTRWLRLLCAASFTVMFKSVCTCVCFHTVALQNRCSRTLRLGILRLTCGMDKCCRELVLHMSRRASPPTAVCCSSQPANPQVCLSECADRIAHKARVRVRFCLDVNILGQHSHLRMCILL